MWVESFTIFARHELGNYDVNGEHDVIFVHCPKLLFDSEDGKRLQELGWSKDYDYTDPADGGDPEFSRDEDASWFHYT